MPSVRTVSDKNYPSTTCGSKASTGATEVVVIAAPGAKKRLRITSIQLTGQEDTKHTVVFRNGISGATFYATAIGPSTASPTYATRDIVFGNGPNAGGFALSENQALMGALEGAGTGVIIGASAVVEQIVD